MKFPSLNQLLISFKKVILRFPIPIIYAIIATVCGIVLSYDLKDIVLEQQLTKGVYLGNFGLALSLAYCLFSESKSLKRTMLVFGNVLIFIILLAIYFILNPFDYQADIIVLLVLGFAFHLLVAIAAFNTKEENNGFWQLNKTFFLRFATSALYSTVLFIGLSIALLSIQTLFNIKWDDKIYFRLWMVIAGIFNTIFFLAGIIEPINELKNDTSYPKGLKVFTQYVLIPLASVYLAILLAYELKIIIEWSLPQSSVAILILGYAVFGILSILLIHPLRNEEGNKWIQLFSKTFYLLMLPLLVLLAISIIKRVMDYGITESRYLLIALAIWLSFITIYFLIKGREQIRIIPISLFLFSILIVFGPWGMKAVSKNSQQKRLTFLLEKKSAEDRNSEVRNIIYYLVNYHTVQSLQPFVKPNLRNLQRQLENKWTKANYSKWEIKQELKDTVLQLIDKEQKYSLGIEATENLKYTNFSVANKGIINVEGSLKVIDLESIPVGSDERKTLTLEGRKFIIHKPNNSYVSLTLEKTTIYFYADSLMKKLQISEKFTPRNDNNIVELPTEKLSIVKSLGGFDFTLIIQSLNGNTKNVYYDGYILVKKSKK
ncbi:MAG: DUF4153 domain-containing protein [Pelobium sp.]